MANVRIVTDSAADLTADTVAEYGIRVAPLSVIFGDKSFLDGETIVPSQFYELLRTDPHFPRTSQPSIGLFEQIYTEARDDGVEVVSIHLSSKLSGTWNAATTAAQAVEGARVHIYDSLNASIVEGEQVRFAAQLAAEGATVQQILAGLDGFRPRLHHLFMLDSLEHVQRGGRIGRAQSLIGSLLSVKPILTILDGEVVPVQRVRTTAKALQELANDARRHAPLVGMRIAHANAPNQVEQLLALLRPFAGEREIPVQPFGPVIGVHAGIGAVGLLMVQESQS